ncbi:hypothetical protein L4D15_02475 [Enterovibrio norvegicus]|uniref:hypothetical protein n=1 Tax=Enterovibrio norvegicus TaxID=188144 RepID=UPI003D0ADB8D
MSVKQFLRSMNQKLAGKLKQSSEFRERMWIVNVRESTLKNEAFVVSEDSFSEPMQWMRRQNYSEYMIDELNQLRLSQSINFTVGNAEHCILRVK